MVEVQVPRNRLPDADIDNETTVTSIDNFPEVTTYLPTTDFAYTYFLTDCRNPIATGAAYWGPGREIQRR